MIPEPTVIVEDLSITYRLRLDRSGSPVRNLLTSGRFRDVVEVQALRNVSVQFNRGETIGIVGSNGSGKSTLMQAISGLSPIDQGRIRVSSQPTLLGVGAALRPALSGRQNIEIGCLVLGMRDEEVAEITDSIIDFAGIRSAIDRPMRTYSSGMRARLTFAIATSRVPEILLLDEALAVGDRGFRKRSEERMQAVRSSAGTVLLVSHSSSVLQTCDRILWLEQGEVRLFGDSGETLKAYEDYADASND
jgi:teichoic acid transport system ATP-binding protein